MLIWHTVWCFSLMFVASCGWNNTIFTVYHLRELLRVRVVHLHIQQTWRNITISIWSCVVFTLFSSVLASTNCISIYLPLKLLEGEICTTAAKFWSELSSQEKSSEFLSSTFGIKKWIYFHPGCRDLLLILYLLNETTQISTETRQKWRLLGNRLYFTMN